MSRVAFFAKSSVCHERPRWDLLRKEEEGSTSPPVAATRADDRAHGVGRSPEGWVARRNAQRLTGTEVGELSGCAAGCSERAGAAAGVGARGLPVLQWCAVPVFARRGRQGGRSGGLLLLLLPHGLCVGGQKGRGGDEEEEGAAGGAQLSEGSAAGASHASAGPEDH